MGGIFQLLAAGFAEPLVRSLISQHYDNRNKKDKDKDKDKDKEKDKNDTPPTLQWVVQGAGRSNGVIGEEVVLLIYPHSCAAPAIDLANLSVSISRKGGVLSETKNFQRIDLGWSCKYTRPLEPGEYTIVLSYVGIPATRIEFLCQATSAIPPGNKTVADLRHSVAYGQGLCSGLAGEKTQFTVRIRDELGGDVPSTYDGSCEVFMFSDASTGDMKLASTSSTIKSGAFVFSYTRPTRVKQYKLWIFINHQYLNGRPIRVKITSQPAIPSIMNSRFNITDTTPNFVDTDRTGLITMMDGDGDRWMEGEIVGLKGTMRLGASGTETPLVLVDLLDGTYSINLRFDQSGLWNIVLTCGQSTSGPLTSEYRVSVLATPTLVGVRCFGPGLSPGLGSGPTFFNIQGYDQYGSRITADQNDFEVVLQHGAPSLSINDTMVCVSYGRPTGTIAYNVVSVLWSAVHVTNSPFLVGNVPEIQATSPEKSIVQSETYRIGESSTAIVLAVDLDGLRRFVGGDNVGAKLDQQELEVIDQQDGTYAVKYIPLTANCILDITINGTALPHFSPESPVPMPSVYGPDNPTAKVGVQATFDIGGVHVDQKRYDGRLVFIMASIVVDVVNVDISATTDHGLRRATYTIPDSTEGQSAVSSASQTYIFRC